MKWSDGIEVYNSDCLEAMKGMKDKEFDLAIVDPPYEASDAIGLVDGNKQAAKRTQYKQFKNVAPDPIYFEQLKRVSKSQIIWGGNFFGLKGGYLCWNKNGTAFGEGEMAWCSMFNSVRFCEYTWNGMIQSDMKNKEKRIHPTQKPIPLYIYLLEEYSKEGDTILDTHMGSGSIAIACHQRGFNLRAYELDKDYYDAAHKRFKQVTAQKQLF